MRRMFHILHPHGGTSLFAEDAEEAVRKTYIPSGFRNALAVIDSDLVAWPGTADAGPFVAFIGSDLFKSPQTALPALETLPPAPRQRPARSKPVADLCNGSARRLKHSPPEKSAILE
jgi:hypothetical protein